MKGKTDKAVEKWFSLLKPSAKNTYSTYFALWQKWLGGMSGDQMLAEARASMQKPETADEWPMKIFQFHQYLLSGAVLTKRRKVAKPLSQKTMRQAVTSIQSFFSSNYLPISLKNFLRRDVRLRKPHVEKGKHQLLGKEIAALLRVSSLRDRAVLVLGLAGQDNITVVNLRIEQFRNKLSGAKLEFLEAVRAKTNTDLVILLTRETQLILADYIRSLGRSEGPLFMGYNGKPMEPAAANDIFQDCARRAGLESNDKRLSFYCCRMWFSAALRNVVSDDLIDLLTGHQLRFEGAYLGDMNKTLELLASAHVEDLLKLQQVPSLTSDIEAQLSKKDVEIRELRQNFEELRNYTMLLSQSMLDARLLKKLPLVDTKPITETKHEHDEETQKKNENKRES